MDDGVSECNEFEVMNQRISAVRNAVKVSEPPGKVSARRRNRPARRGCYPGTGERRVKTDERRGASRIIPHNPGWSRFSGIFFIFRSWDGWEPWNRYLARCPAFAWLRSGMGKRPYRRGFEDEDMHECFRMGTWQRPARKGVFAKRSHLGNWHNRRQQRDLNGK
jgi:hypothetical protein